MKKLIFILLMMPAIVTGQSSFVQSIIDGANVIFIHAGDTTNPYVPVANRLNFGDALYDETKIFNVLDYGTDPTGLTLNTTQLQSAITAAGDSAIVYFPSGTYLTGTLTITNKHYLRITGSGKLHLTGTNVYGFRMVGTCDDIEIDGLTIYGNGLSASGQEAISNASGQILSNIRIHDLNIYDVILGISLNADLSGSIDRCRIYNNYIHNIVGTGAGQGYGIHLAKASNTIIEDNRIDSAQRHSIYHAKSIVFANNIIRNNIITNHRIVTHDDNITAALEIVRSIGVIATGNIFKDCYDVCIYIGHETSGGYETKNITVENNIIINRLGNAPGIAIGEQLEPTTVITKNININNNTFYTDASVSASVDIYILDGRRIMVNNNTFYRLNCAGATEGAIYLGADAYNSATHITDSCFITKNIFIAEGPSLTGTYSIGVCGDICVNPAFNVIQNNIYNDFITGISFASDVTNTLLKTGDISISGQSIIKKTIAHPGHTGANFTFTSVANSDAQNIDLGAILPAKSRVTAFEIVCTESLAGSGTHEILFRAGNWETGANYIADISCDDANEVAGIIDASIPDGIIMNWASANNLWIGANPDDNWNTYTAGMWTAYITYQNYINF